MPPLSANRYVDAIHIGQRVAGTIADLPSRKRRSMRLAEFLETVEALLDHVEAGGVAETHRFVVSLIGDVMFVASLFVLGGDFWDKVRSLFVHDAEVHFPVVSAGKDNVWKGRGVVAA